MTITVNGVWWLSGISLALRPEGRRFEYRSSHHLGIMDKSFTHIYL